MADIDEYDAYNLDFDIDSLPYIIDLPPSPEKTAPQPGSTSTEATVIPDATDAALLQTPKSSYSDEFTAYDFSEFTAEDLDSLDATTVYTLLTSEPDTNHHPPSPACADAFTYSNVNPISSDASRSNTSSGYFGGPAIEIQIEPSTNDSGVFKAEDVEQEPIASTSAHHMPKSHKEHGIQTSVNFGAEPSPFERFRRYNRVLAVTDLTGPSWCEVQFDYGLRQKRSRKLKDRLSSFVSVAGKVIAVNQDVASDNDKTARRGKSVHKALERQIHPEEVSVTVKTAEERWGLRLVKMIDSLRSLLAIGRCREMPVFGILHNDVVVGVIDEIERKALVEAESHDPTITISSPRAKPSPANKLKRSTKTRSVPSTPSKPKSKRACRSPSPSQPSITSFFPLSPSKVATDEEMQESGETNMRPVTPVSDLPESRRTYPPLPRFKLHLSDTKTRSHATLPREEDTLPARLQLMLYHRLLANLLETPSCSQALDFDELWIRLGVSPSLPFSATFREQTGLPMQGPRRDRVGCLSDLVRMWRNAVEMIYVEDLDPALTVVYRTQPRKSRKGKDKGKGKAKSASRHQEDQDIAEAVAPTKDQEPGIDNEYQGPSHAGAENTDSAEHNPIIVDPGGSFNGIDTNNAAPSNFGDIFTPSVPEEDVDLQWAIQQSLLEQIQANPELNETLVSAESAEQQQQDTDDEDAGCAPEQSTVIGTKTFQLDDVLLDDYLTNVLDWWHGRRAPRGVDIELTKRCLWCEYREGCEWREMKAEEAKNKLRERETTLDSTTDET